jgi:predicted MPP superfamily phosphohydrolase
MLWNRFLLIVIGSTALDVLAAVTSLLHPGVGQKEEGPRIIDMRRIGIAALATSAVFLAKLVVVALLVPLNPFGLIHLVYADLVVVLSAAGLVVLAVSLVRSGGNRVWSVTPLAQLTALAGLAMVPVGIYATWIEPFRLRLERTSVPLASRGAGNSVVRIGVLTDLQMSRVTDYERAAVDRMLAQRPDVILLPGDVFQGSPEEFEANREALRELLARLSAPGGVYLVLGDTDRGGLLLREILPLTSIRLLVDEVTHVAVGDRRVTIGGIQLDFSSAAAQRTVRTLEEEPGSDDLRILVAHRPDVILGMRPSSRVDLVVAGHTHGGQIVIPGFGPPMTLSRVPRTVAAGGLHTLDGNRIYVSRGVGCERGQAPRIRFFCPPEISLLELTNKKGAEFAPAKPLRDDRITLPSVE